MDMSSSMSRTFAVGSAMSAATSFRVGASWLTLWSEQAPRLLDLWLKAGEGTEASATAETELRDQLFNAAREAATRVNSEVVGGINDVDKFTKPKRSSAHGAPPSVGQPPA
jgi:hypothetical protein